MKIKIKHIHVRLHKTVESSKIRLVGEYKTPCCGSARCRIVGEADARIEAEEHFCCSCGAQYFLSTFPGDGLS